MERIAKFIVIIFLAAAVSIPLVGRFIAQRGSTNTVVMHARMPQNGGWGQEVIQAEVGKPLHLRLTSDDVQHSFTVGQVDMQPVDVEPGQWKDVTLEFDKPGSYTFYCDRWCCSEHWRMRGVIEVRGTGGSTGIQPTVAQPLYLALKIDVDAPHPAKAVPATQPDAARGATLADQLPAYTRDRQVYLASSPSALFERLRAESSLKSMSDADLWDAAAWVWQQNTSPEALETGKQLFARNCAACHGETGKGDGVMVRDLPTPMPDMSDMAGGSSKTRPPDLTDPKNTLGASPALLGGKMIRGGMGTGMPMWGSIFTQDQINALVSYIYTEVR